MSTTHGPWEACETEQQALGVVGTLRQAQQPQGVRITSLLRLSPPPVEAAFWRSPAANRLLKASDCISLCYSVVMLSIVLVRRRHSLPPPYNTHMAFFACSSTAQLLVLWRRPKLHQRYRLQITVVNRVLRLLSTAELCRRMSPATFGPMLASGGLHALLGPPLLLLNGSNFVLPWEYALPAQLWTLGWGTLAMQAFVCATWGRPGPVAVSQQACVALKHTMHMGAGAFGLPLLLHHSADAALQEACRGLPGLLLLGLFTYVMLLLVLPCLVVYFVELSLKVAFVAAQPSHLQLCDTWPIMQSRLIKAVTGVAVVLGSWFTCEALVAAFTPTECSSAGALTFAPVYSSSSSSSSSG